MRRRFLTFSDPADRPVWLFPAERIVVQAHTDDGLEPVRTRIKLGGDLDLVVAEDPTDVVHRIEDALNRHERAVLDKQLSDLADELGTIAQEMTSLVTLIGDALGVTGEDEPDEQIAPSTGGAA